MSVTRVRQRGGGGGKGCLLLNCLLLCDGPRAYTANMSLLKIIKKNKVLTSLGFSRRCWTIIGRNSSWEILIPLIRSSCSASAKNMQFPSPWLSEIAKPFSNAVLFKACDSSVLLDSMRASRMICWSTIKMGSPVNGRWTTYHKIEVISCQFNRRWCTGLKLKTADNLIKKYCGLQRTK